MTPSRFDRATSVFSGAPQTFGGLTLIRTTAKATLNHYRPSLLGADHQWKIGGQIEKGEGYGPSIIPTGVRFVDDNGRPFQAISSDPSMTGGSFITAAAFASDAITVGDRLTISAGVRFDHSRAISQDLHAIDPTGHETDRIIERTRNAVHLEPVVAAPRCHDEAHRRRPNDFARAATGGSARAC